MKANSCVFNMVCGAVLCLLALPVWALSPYGEEQGVATGYVVALRGGTLAVSNVPMGSGESGGQAPRVMMRRHDGTTRELKGEEARKALEKARQGGSVSVNVTEENGEKRYKVTGPDGVTKEYTEEEFEKLREEMHGARARKTNVTVTDDGKKVVKVGEGSEGKSPMDEAHTPATKVEFTRFEVNDETKLPETLDRGTKIRVHFRTEGDRKIATRVESII